MNRRPNVLIAVMALMMAACATATDTTTTTTTSSTAPPDPTTTTIVAEASSTTDPPASGSDRSIGDQLAWFMTVLNGAELTADEYEARFAQVFKEQVAFADFLPLIDQITAGSSGWAVIDTESSGSTNLAVLIAPSGGEPVLRLLLNIDSEGRIDGLFFQPGEPPTLDDPPESYDEAFEQLAGLGTAGVLVAETTDGTCVPIAEQFAETALPLGSMFKVYVLGAVTEAISAGEIAWHDPVTLDEANYSLPTGITQTEEPGTQRSVRELAQRMIEISDNTATDHLIALAGREAVEAIQSEMGHADPSLNIPFLTTRELFQLKVGDQDALTAYVDGDVAARRQVLDGLGREPLPDLGAVTDWTEPVEVLSAEWFASPLDLCQAWVDLAGRAAQSGLEPLADVVGANPGLADETGVWDDIWFKGGSEPGVLGMSWYLTTVDGRSFAVAGSVTDDSQALNEIEAILLFGSVRDLLAAEVSG